MGLNGKQLLENFKEDEAYGNTTYTPPADEDSNDDNAWKYISAGDISGLADYTNRNYNYRTIPFLGQIVGHAADAATQGVADVAQFVGAQGVGDYLNEKAQKGEAELPAMSTPELSLAYLTDPNGLASAFGMLTGSMLSTLPVAAIAPELLPARAAMALSKVPKALSAVPKIGGALEEMAPMAGRFALTGPVEAMMEGGNTEREMLQNGATPEEARQAAWNVFGENVGLLTATNALEGGLLGKIKIKTPHFSNPIVNTASRVAGYVPTTAAEMALQGYEEGAQQGIQNGVEGESPNTANQILNPFAWTDDQWDAAKLGVAGAVPLMGAMGAIRHFGNRGDNGSAAADSLLDQAQDDIDSITSQAAQQSVIQSAQQDMENNPYTAPTAMQDTSYEAPSDTSDTSSGASYDASALEGDPQYTVSGEVSSTDVTPLTDQKMRLLDAAYYNKYGQHLFVTSMKRNGDGGSWHDSGQAFDTADDNLENNKEARDWLISEGEKLGLTPLDEYEHPSANATGGHIHFSDHGEPIPDGIRVGESDSDMDDSDMDDSTGGVDLSNLPVGDIAMAIAQNTNLPVNFIWSQLSHESDGGKSKLAVEDHNYGGVKGTDGNYLHFDNDQQFIDYMSKYYPKYREDGIYDAQTADQFAEALQHGGYFTADLGEYEGGMHRYLEQAGLSQDAMSVGKTRRSRGSKRNSGDNSTPDLSGSFDISADDPAMDSMFASFAKDWQNMSTDANEINFFGDMFNSRNKFKATEENKQAILDNYGDAFRQYVQENQPQTVQAAQTAQAPAQPKQVPQPQHIEMQTPNLQTITTPKVEATTIQNVLSSFVQDKKNVARTEQEANLFDDMLDADDHFIDTPKNRQTLLKNYGAQLQDYVDDAMTPSLTDRVNQAIEQAVQNKDLNRMNTLTQAKQANDMAALEKLVGPQTKQHVDIAAMLTPANTDMKNHVSSTVQGNVPVNQVAATEDEQKAFRKAGLVYRDSNYNGTERVKTAPLYEEGDRRMNGGKSETKVKAQTAGKADKYKKDAEKIYLRFKSGKFSTEDSIKQLNNLKKKATSDKALSGEDRTDVITEADKHINRIKPQKETKKHETQKYSSKTSKTTQSGKAEGYTHQHTEPEPRKAADTQREAEEGKVKRRETRDKYYESVISDPRWKEIENELTPDGVKRMKKALAYSTSKHKKKLDRDIVLYRLYDTWFDYRGIAHDDMGIGVKGLREPQHSALGNMRKIAALQDKVDAIMADHYQDSGNKKTADEGGHTVQELAPGYKTESGKPLSEAGEKEFILKPDGSKDFGEITAAISKAAKEQHNVELAPGKIRLRVGNDKEGLIHAKKHEEQAKEDGYASIEDMIADVAENFDRIYERQPDSDGGHSTYSLVQTGNKVMGKMNGVSPLYFEMEKDGHDGYYLVISAIPKGDANLKRSTKKDRLIYSSPGLGAATQSNAGAVSHDGRNVGAVNRGGIPASDKSSGSSTHIIPHEQKEGTKNLDTGKVPAMGEPIHGIKGTETTVVTDNGKEIRVRYRVVPASRVITSHDAETMTPNKAYPHELQPRDRQRVSMQEQVTTMANELRPADLGAGRNLNQGAPIIRKDGVVLNGNGRAMAIQKATAAGGGKATAYRKYIFEHSKEFGISRSNLSQMRKYMLVREVVDDIDADMMQDIIGSTAGGSRMGASEQAKADAKKIKPRDLERYVDNEQGDLTTAANQDFVADILYRIVSKNERNAYTDEHGNVNADGIQRVKRALFSLAYDDDGLIDKMAESTDDNIRNVSRGLMNAAPAFARVNLAVADGQAYPYNADKTVSEAVKRLDALRSEGKPVKDYLNEQSMFSEYQDTDEMRDVLRFFDDNKRSGKKIGIFLNDIANSIMMQGDPNQTSLMNGERATLGEIIKTSARVASNGTSSADLFADVQEAPTKAKENTTQAIDDIRYSAKQNDAQVKRSLQAVVDEAKKAFPNAKNIRQDGGHISMDMPNGAEVQINVVPSIEVNNEEAGRARAAHGLKDDVRIKINGGERTVGRTALIELSQLGRKGTAYHEAFHAVYDLCLTEKEKAALHRAFDKEAKAQGRDVYEVMADKYRDWMIAKQKGRHTLYGKLWQKVKDAAAKLARVVRGADSASDVFRKVASGEAWERPLNEGSSDNRYLVTNEEVRPDTEVPIVDVTNEKKINVNSNKAAADIAKSLQGVTFRIIASNGVGKIETLKEGKHFVHGSNNLGRFDKTRAKALSVSEKILDNCVYIEKHPDAKHGTNHRYIELFAAVKDGRNMVRFRVVAREGDAGSGEFKIGQARFYDIIKDGKLPMYDTNGRNSIMGSSPSTLTIAELLKSVKDREGHLYVNKDGSLNYDTRIFHNGEEQGGSPSDVRNSADLFAIRPGEPIRYSLDANDNSKPSLFTRAYNHLTGRKNAASHDKNVKAMLEDITKMRIRFGKLDPKTETVFKKFEGVIRARNANEWEKVLPEAGRAIADRLNLKPSEDMNNYIAKWLLDEATNDTSQEASDFAAALKNDPVLSDQLVDLKTLFNERNNREADEVVRDAIQYEKPKERTTLTKAWETFYDEMIEELGPVKRMVKRVQEKSGQELAASVNPYIALRLFRGNAGRAMTMIEGQSEVAVKALQTNYPGVNFNDFKTLHMILDECGALHNEKRMKDFLAFALACHVKDIHTLNNRIRKSQQRLRDKIADLNDKINNLPEYQQLIESDKKVDDKYQEQREAYQKEIEGYQAKIDKAEKTIMEVPRTEDGLSLTEDRCNKVMMKYMKEYGEAQQDLVHFSKVTTSILYDAGVISKKRYKELQERWPNYIPMFRVFEDNEEVDFGDSLKHMHGSTRRIINPLDSIIRNTYDFVKKAERNKARQLLADLTRISDVGEYIEEVDNSKPNDKTTITFYENGERKYLQTDPDIVKAVNNMGREESNWVLRLLHGPAKIARACFTTINPSFALRNLIRDSTDATIYSKYGFKPWDFVRGFLHAVHRDELFYEWLSSGAAQASAISLDRDYTQATLNQMSKTWKERLLSKEFLPAILEGMQMVGEYSEYGTRIAAYERAKKKLAGENGPHPAAYDLASAAFESRDLMDFARGGRGSRHLNNVVVFANASIQGFDKFFRTFDFRKPYRKESMKALARLFLCGMLPALLLAGIHSGDDWWEELPDWQKETNWILGKVGNTIIRIPKGQDIGLRFFSNLIEKAMDRSKHKAGDYFKPVWDSLPDMIPTALLPIIEATANHSYFTGAPVVPKYQEKLPAYLQFGNETSSFAKFVGKVIGVSPRKVEHVLFGYTGNMGKGLLGVYDTIVGNQSLNTNLNEAPVISGFTAIPYKQSKTVNDFYDKFDEQQRLNEEFKLTKKKPDGYDPSLYKRMTKAQQELSKINKQERAAIDDPKMDSGVREQKQLGYQQQRLSVVRRVMGQ